MVLFVANFELETNKFEELKSPMHVLTAGMIFLFYSRGDNFACLSYLDP